MKKKRASIPVIKILVSGLLTLIVLVTGVYFFLIKPQFCPDNYIILNQDKLYKGKVCVAKYEMKKGPEGEAVSTASGLPWTNITRDEAVNACKKLGSRYDLISNSVWTSMARGIATVEENWNSNIANQGRVNRGNISTKLAKLLEASPDDNNSCFGTSENCGIVEWKEVKRTFILPNNKIIWDISGNAAEWVSEEFSNYATISPQSFFYKMEDVNKKGIESFSPVTKCDNHDCGFGVFQIAKVPQPKNYIIRGGSWFMPLDESGIFYAMVGARADKKNPTLGFRCMYQIPAN